MTTRREGLHVIVRTPLGVVYDAAVHAIRAEDESGWFGIRPGREPVIAVLPPGLLLLHDDEGEGFVALSGGLLRHDGVRCLVLAREAVVARALEDVADRLAAQLARRRERGGTQRDAVHALAREVLRRMVAEVRG